MHDASDVEGDLQMAMDGAHLVEQSARLAHGECDPTERGPLGEFRLKYLDFAIQDAENALGKYQHAVRTLQGDKKEAFEKKVGVIAADTMLARDKLRAARKRELMQLGVPRCE